MHELSHLFALLVGTRRKYVDPSKAVEILKEAFSSDAGSADNQQVATASSYYAHVVTQSFGCVTNHLLLAIYSLYPEFTLCSN